MDGQQIGQFRDHVGCVYRLALSHDERWLLSGGKDKVIRVWDAKTGQIIARATGHTSGISGFSFSADDAWFASSSEDGTVACWETKTGELYRRFTEPARLGDSLMDVSVSSDGKWVASGGGGKDAYLHLWDVQANKPGKAFKGHKIVEREKYWRCIESLRFLPDNQHFISCGVDSTMRIWNVSSGEEVFRRDVDSGIWRFALSEDGRRAVTGHNDGSVRVWLLPAFSNR